MFTGRWMPCYDTRRTYGAKALVGPVRTLLYALYAVLSCAHGVLSPTASRLRCSGSPTLANGKNEASFVACLHA